MMNRETRLSQLLNGLPHGTLAPGQDSDVRWLEAMSGALDGQLRARYHLSSREGDEVDEMR